MAATVISLGGIIMRFCGELPFSSGTMPTALERMKLVTFAIYHESLEENPYFVLAFRKQMGYEWQAFRFPARRALINTQARHEHLLRRKNEKFRFYVIETGEDHKGCIHLRPMIPLTSFIRDHVMMKRIFLREHTLETKTA